MAWIILTRETGPADKTENREAHMKIANVFSFVLSLSFLSFFPFTTASWGAELKPSSAAGLAAVNVATGSIAVGLAATNVSTAAIVTAYTAADALINVATGTISVGLAATNVATETLRVGLAATNVSTATLVIRAGDTMTGQLIISGSAGDQLFRVGVASMVVRLNGNIGIGTTAPGSILEARGSGLSDVLRISSGDASNFLTVKNDGFVGIGTTASLVGRNMWIANGILELGTSGASHGVINSANNLILNIDDDNNNTDAVFAVGLNHYLSNSTRLFTVEETGNVGVGISVPTAVLQVVPKTLAPATRVFAVSSQTATTELLSVTAGGNVGIGTTAPAQLLDIAATNPCIRLSGGASGGPGLLMYRSTVLKTMLGLSTGAGGLIDSSLDGDLVIRNNQAILFNANEGTGEHLRLTSAGKLGVGTSNPLGKLHISAVAGNDTRLLSVSSVNAAELLSVLSSGNIGVGTSVPTATLDIRTVGPQMFNVGAGTFTVLQTGNVGIGTTAPTFDLHVVGPGGGTGYFASTLRVDSTLNPRGNILLGTLPVIYQSGAGSFSLGNTDGANLNVVGISTLSNVANAMFIVGAGSMTVLNTGNVGIGTTAPLASLDVSGPIGPGLYTLAQMEALVIGRAGLDIHISNAVVPYQSCTSTATAVGSWVKANTADHCQ